MYTYLYQRKILYIQQKSVISEVSASLQMHMCAYLFLGVKKLPFFSNFMQTFVISLLVLRYLATTKNENVVLLYKYVTYQ